MGKGTKVTMKKNEVTVFKKRHAAKVGINDKAHATAIKVERHRESRGKHLEAKDLKQLKQLRKATTNEAGMLRASKKYQVKQVETRGTSMRTRSGRLIIKKAKLVVSKS